MQKIHDKRKILLQRALTHYATHSKAQLSLDQWFEAQEAKRGKGIIALRYRELMKRV